MKRFIYIVVGLILISSLMPTINYSAPASYLEITIESPEASPEMLLEAQDVITKRLEAFGITAFEMECHPEQQQIHIRFRESLQVEEVAPLLTNLGRLEFCEAFARQEVFQILNEGTQKEAWKQWLPLGSETGDDGAVIDHIASTAIPTFERFVLDQKPLNVLPQNLSFAYGRTTDEEGRRELFALRFSQASMAPILTGSAVEHSQANYDELTKTASINLTFDEAGSADWAQATRKNIRRPIAIVFDDMVFFAPRVMVEITSGQAQVTGDFSKEEARLVAALVQGGELPAPFQVKEIKQ